ncbi:MAG: hypothetical protein Q7S45_03020 [Candidatus Curtissbacteria bacterium]|nr:hypothetical protein [Candidatus Curtissbacteria bacterium]
MRKVYQKLRKSSGEFGPIVEIGSLFLLYSTFAMNERLRQEDPSKVTRIEKPEGVYTIVYGAHNRRTNLDFVPPDLDAFVIEWPSDRYGQELPEYFSGLGRLFLPQFSSVLDYAERYRIPVYHADLGIRSFIAFPEIYLLPFRPTSRLRETITAHKEEWLMKNVEGLNHLVTVIGAAHTGIEGQIRKRNEDRLNSLQRLGPIIRGISRQRSVYSIPRFDFNGNEWELGKVLEVPDLRELVS